jgi:hypothetical protein
MMRDRVAALVSSGSTVLTDLVEVDDETDLLADCEGDVCPACGSLLIEDEEDVDPLSLVCPVCDVLHRVGAD